MGVQTDGTDRKLRGELGYQKDRSKASLLCLFRASLIQGCPEKIRQLLNIESEMQHGAEWLKFILDIRARPLSSYDGVHSSKYEGVTDPFKIILFFSAFQIKSPNRVTFH